MAALPPDEADRRVRNDKPGKIALHWLLVHAKDDAEAHSKHVVEAVSRTGFLYELCYFLIKEGDEEMLWFLISSEGSEFDDPAINSAYDRWRAFVLTSMCQANLDMASCNENPAADQALCTFFRMIDLTRIYKDHHLIKKVPLNPAAQAVVRRLSHEQFGATNVQLWDRFARACRRIKPNEFQGGSMRLNSRHLMVTNLEICHPTRPSPDGTLQDIRTCWNGSEVLPEIIASREVLRFHIARSINTEKLLIKQQRIRESREVRSIINILRELEGKLFGESASAPATKTSATGQERSAASYRNLFIEVAPRMRTPHQSCSS